MSKKWWQFWKGEQKMSGQQLAMLLRQNSAFTSYNFSLFVEEAYNQNPTVYRCIQEYVRAWNSCPIVIKRGEDVITNTTLSTLLNKPNDTQNLLEFMEQAIIYYLIAGECPVWGDSVIPTRPPKSLYILRPDWLTPYLEQNGMGKVSYWQYTSGDLTTSSATIYPSNFVLWKAFNPLCRYRGSSPLSPCAYAIDQLNEYAKTNYSLLKNGMQPSGALSTEQVLTDESFARLKEEFNETYQGSDNNGKPLMLEGGLKWQPFSFNLRDAEFLGGKTSAKKDICEALGVPTQLLGIDGSQTYANYEQARASFYEDSAIPLLDSFLAVLSQWLGLKVGLEPNDVLCVDIDGVAALEPRRAERNQILDKLQSISTNEKRAAMGYESVDGGDEILVNSGLVPLDMAGADIPPINPML